MIDLNLQTCMMRFSASGAPLDWPAVPVGIVERAWAAWCAVRDGIPERGTVRLVLPPLPDGRESRAVGWASGGEVRMILAWQRA